MNNSQAKNLIIALSVAIPVLVALLIFSPIKTGLKTSWIGYLPAFHATVNSLTALVLIMALVAIRKKNVKLHRTLMTIAFILGTLFLLSYVTYHSSVESVRYGDLDHDGVVSASEKLEAGSLRMVYLGTLLSHILLSIAVVPLVLMSFYYALISEISKHRKIVKYTFPIWLYVSVTGVIVYFLIRPYYF